ncbi:MAG: LuxR C-terminal-related transcriptional regulator [Planctomycetota bacterium]
MTQPATDAGDPSEFNAHHAVWAALTSEPQTGVSVITDEGRIVYLNEQAAEIFLGPDMHVADVAGRKLDELYPSEFAEERHRLVQRVIHDDQPVLFRAIWRGHQHLSWIYPIHLNETPPLEGELEADTLHLPKVLVITRRTQGDAADAILRASGVERVDADVIDLGELDILSPRELVVVALLGRGLSLKETAKALHRSVRTIETQRDSIGRKLQLADRSELIKLIQRVGLTVDDTGRVMV